MKFQVPQFIEIEDKLFGPLTFKQFLYVGGGLGLAFIFFKFIPYFYVALVPMILSVAFGCALAFYKINNRSFVEILESALKFYMGTKLYIWKKQNKPINKKEETEEDGLNSLYVPRLSDSKLKDLTWKLDIKEVINPGTAEMKK